jgi:hypothetical protein
MGSAKTSRNRLGRLKQAGSLRTDAGGGRWMTFSATHLAVPRSTGFVWRARVTVAPLIHVRVREALVGGVGSGQVSLLSRSRSPRMKVLSRTRHTAARWGSFDGGYRELPWEGHFQQYERRTGIAVPMTADVGWYIDGAVQSVWKGQMWFIDG